MKAVMDFTTTLTLRKTITIPKEFEFIYDGTDEDDYSLKQWDLTDEWYEHTLPTLLGVDTLDETECWEIIED